MGRVLDRPATATLANGDEVTINGERSDHLP